MKEKQEAAMRKICAAYADKGRHIESGWFEYCAKVRASGRKRREFNDARAVFFSGAQFMWKKIVELSLAPNDSAEQNGADLFYQVYEELQQQGFISNADYPTAGNA